MKKSEDNLMEKVVSLAKRRGFVFPGSDIYGGLSNSWDYGPLGVELKNNIKNLWWEFFVHKRDDIYGLDSAIITHPKVWEASGHIGGFADPLVDCRACKNRFRADDLLEEKLKINPAGKSFKEMGDLLKENKIKCPTCGKLDWTEVRQFNLLFKTHIGVVEDEKSAAYLRGETAQGIFINFKNIVDSMSPKIPFGIAQMGKAFRNEITPGNFIFRTREFEQMEIEYFVREGEWKKWFEHWLEKMKEWIDFIGIDTKKIHFNEIQKEELAHYSKRTVDIEFEFPFGKKELYGLAYRTDFDLKKHQEYSGQKLEYLDQETKERFTPHVIEPSLGVDRTLLAILVSAYREDEVGGEKRVYLNLDPKVAPFRVAVFPLLSNKDNLVEKAGEIFDDLVSSKVGPIDFDKSGNIGKRYRKQDEIGTPYCVTVDFQTLEDETVTLRDRNTTKQERVKISELAKVLAGVVTD